MSTEEVERLLEELRRLSAKYTARRSWRRVDCEIAEWRAADSRQVIEVRFVLLESLVRRRVHQAVSVAAWRAWFAALSERVLSVVWKSVLPSWSPWTGLAPPAVPPLVQRK